jgi:hypothetical protein
MLRLLLSVHPFYTHQGFKIGDRDVGGKTEHMGYNIYLSQATAFVAFLAYNTICGQAVADSVPPAISASCVSGNVWT